MKIAISGKGGSGKTTLSTLLARTLAGSGRAVIAVDADPTANLGAVLGLARDQWPTPISEMRDLIRERTGADKAYGSYFQLNPDVRDLPEKFSKLIHGVRLLTLGGVAKGGSGCICPESTLLKALVTHLLMRPDDVVIMDMEAGIEHLGRATAQAVSMMIIVADPGQQSLQAAQTIRRLAGEIHIPRVGVVINKVPPGMDLGPVTARFDGLPVLGTLSMDPQITEADFDGRCPYTGREPQTSEVRRILDAILAQNNR